MVVNVLLWIMTEIEESEFKDVPKPQLNAV